jgi:hypothetical protein
MCLKIGSKVIKNFNESLSQMTRRIMCLVDKFISKNNLDN